MFSSPISKNWREFLTLVELLFTIPVCNAKLERMFSKLKFVKTEFRCSLSTNRLENLLRIFECRPSVEEYDVMPALKRWAADKVRRPVQSQRKNYKKRVELKRKIGSLSDSDSESGSDNSFTEIQEVEDNIFSDNEI